MIITIYYYCNERKNKSTIWHYISIYSITNLTKTVYSNQYFIFYNFRSFFTIDMWYYNIITHDDRKDGFVWILFFFCSFDAYYIVCYAFIVLGGLFPSTAVNVSAVVNNLPARTKYSHDTYRLTKLLRLFTTADDKYLKIFCTRIYARWIRTCVKTCICLKKPTYYARKPHEIKQIV